ncbi:cytochrome P450 4c3-like [Pieris rapae]|uniref:cytochrome P450 4c3-like n=1 Tax=Pieris rapae TaxID=64459 RepID=UPI001E27E6BC|nr:cytochrome P450 4c3-like [Pieris rapae]
MSLTIINIVFVILCYALYRYKRRRVHELADKIPSPPGASSVFGALKYSLLGKDMILVLLMEYSRYAHKTGCGMVKFMTDPHIYIGVSDRDDVEYIMKNCLEKENVMHFFTEVIGNAGIFAPVSTWIHRRKMLIPAFSPKIVKGFISMQARQGLELSEQLEIDGRVGSGEFSIWPYINAYTLSSIAETALGVKLDAQRDSNIPFLKAVQDVLCYMSSRLIKVWLWPQFIYKYSKLHADIQASKTLLYKLPDKIIKEKREALYNNNKVRNSHEKQTIYGQGEDQKSFLDHLIILSEEDNRLSDEELREEILVMMLAGTDSSAVAIGYTLVLLGKYPEIQEKLYSEIKNHLGNSDRPLNSDDLLALEYLSRVVKESLRLFPPAPAVTRRAGDKEVHLPSGIILPKETGIVISIWGMNRDPKQWGPTAECFDPDRFSDKQTATYASFSLGPRNCIGYKYALQSVQIAVASIIRRYKVVGEPEKGPVPTIDSTFSIMMRAKDDFKIALENRNN